MPDGQPLTASPFPSELEGMQEIALPQPVSRAPQTVGWTVVFGVLLLAAAGAAWWAWRRYRRNAYRRLALARLGRSDLRDLPALLKRTALDAYPREAVADLSGHAWLVFLDRTYGGTDFTKGIGRVLPTLAYERESFLTDAAADAIFSLADTWIRKHHV